MNRYDYLNAAKSAASAIIDNIRAHPDAWLIGALAIGCFLLGYALAG